MYSVSNDKELIRDELVQVPADTAVKIAAPDGATDLVAQFRCNAAGDVASEIFFRFGSDPVPLQGLGYQLQASPGSPAFLQDVDVNFQKDELFVFSVGVSVDVYIIWMK